MIELAPESIVADVDRLRAALDRPRRDGGPLVLVGRPRSAFEQLVDAQPRRCS